MNTNPQAKGVLCYGDSNTWGQSDDKSTAGRYPANVRWTGGLQRLLGDSFYIIEEGLGGRTTDLEHYNPNKPSRNGLTYFVPCLDSHAPLDVAVIMLGSNDLKIQYDRSPNDIAGALELYVEAIKNSLPSARILLVSPIYVNNTAPKFVEYYHDTYDAQSAIKSKGLAEVISTLAEENGCLFFDASTVASAGQDGIHFDKRSHLALAEALADIIDKL